MGQAACYSLRVQTNFGNAYGQIEGKEKNKRFEMTRRENDEKDVSKDVKEVTLDGVRSPRCVRCIEGMELGGSTFI